MKLPLSWLNEYVNTENITTKEYAHGMTMSGSKVEGYETACGDITKVVIAQILKIEKHPDADKLKVCSVDVGSETLQIVTGAPNVSEGDKIPLALCGSHLAGGIKISKGKLRGVESFGMMCSEEEIGININDEKSTGVLILDKDAPVGADFVEEYGLKEDIVEFEITSNRPDCMSVIGLARETAATFNLPLTIKAPKYKETEDKIEDYLKVTAKDNTALNRYMAKVVKNVKIAPSPEWMQRRLNRAGVRAINNIVDITNYVMLEYGQPMHAFDINYVNGAEIIVRKALPGEEIMTLDGTVRKLDESILVIADKDKPNAVAGVMGGEFSGVNENTSTVVFESANFDGPSVRKAAQKIGLRTESSARFEKGIDKNLCPDALARALELVEMLGAGEVVSGVIDINEKADKEIKLPLEADRINAFLGTSIEKEEMIRILKSLDFTVENDMVTPPSFRIDIACFNDIAEEVARIYGYNEIPSTPLSAAITEGKYSKTQIYENKIKDFLSNSGAYEAYTYSFTSPKLFKMLNLKEDAYKTVEIKNPLGADNSIMRPTLIHSMLEALRTNYNQRNKDVLLYEIANIYLNINGCDELPEERKTLIIGGYGNIDFFKLKGIVDMLLLKLNIAPLKYTADEENPTFHPYRTAALTDKSGNRAGVIGEIHPSVCENYEIEEKVYIAQLDLETLYESLTEEILYKKLPKFPAVTRDLAMLVDENVTVGEIEEIITSGAGKYLETIKLFDVYQGKQIPEGKKSVAFNFTLRSADHTLTDEEISGCVEKILKALKNAGAELR